MSHKHTSKSARVRGFSFSVPGYESFMASLQHITACNCQGIRFQAPKTFECTRVREIRLGARQGLGFQAAMALSDKTSVP